MSIETSSIQNWIQESLDLKHCKIEIEATTNKGEGYVGELIFVKVTQDTKKELNIVVKTGKMNPELRKKSPIVHQFPEREVQFYSKIFPTLEAFWDLKNPKEPLEIVPKCYKTFLTDNYEVVVMNNLRTQGYELYPKQMPLNLEHAKLGLTNYAKLHAASLAMSDQRKESFDKISDNLQVYIKDLFVVFKPFLDNSCSNILKNLKDLGREDLESKFEELFNKKSALDYFCDLLDDPLQERVIVHGDSNKSNYLFEYRTNNKNTPTNMKLVDFQTAILHSPMIDISHFLYAGLSKKELKRFNELMEFYYHQLSTFVLHLGSNPNELFSRATMWKHWKKYSTYGFILAATIMELTFVVKEEAPSFEGGDNSEICDSFLELKIASKEKYMERVIAIAEHYFNQSSR